MDRAPTTIQQARKYFTHGSQGTPGEAREHFVRLERRLPLVGKAWPGCLLGSNHL